MNLNEIKSSMREVIEASFHMFADTIDTQPFVLRTNIIEKLREADFHYKEEFILRQFDLADTEKKEQLDFDSFTTFYFMLNSLSCYNPPYHIFDRESDFVEIGVLPCGYLYCKDDRRIFFTY